MTHIEQLAKDLAYGSLDLLTAGRGIRRVVNGEVIRFPARWFRYYPSDYEPHTFCFLRQNCHAGDTVLDIGAHIGLFSVLMARLVGPTGRVFSFEPSQLTATVLGRTVLINGCQNIVEVRKEAVTRTTGHSMFFDTGDPGSNANSLIENPRHIQALSVPTTTVDQFVTRRTLEITCLKVDVEGAELDVLYGARHTMQCQRPSLSLALHPEAVAAGGGSLGQVWDFLQEFNFTVRRHREEVTRSWFCGQTGLFEVQCQN